MRPSELSDGCRRCRLVARPRRFPHNCRTKKAPCPGLLPPARIASQTRHSLAHVAVLSTPLLRRTRTRLLTGPPVPRRGIGERGRRKQDAVGLDVRSRPQLTTRWGVVGSLGLFAAPVPPCQLPSHVSLTAKRGGPWIAAVGERDTAHSRRPSEQHLLGGLSRLFEKLGWHPGPYGAIRARHSLPSVRR